MKQTDEIVNIANWNWTNEKKKKKEYVDNVKVAQNLQNWELHFTEANTPYNFKIILNYN